jgi:5-methylcytosine-specific restriction endonuclease McrA
VATADRAKFAAIYGSKRWRTIRRQALQAHSFCTWPECHAVATIVDHGIPLGEAIRQCRESKRWPYDPDAGAFLLNNLTGLCARHHGDKTALDKAHVGPWNSVLEKYDQTPRHQFTA